MRETEGEKERTKEKVSLLKIGMHKINNQNYQDDSEPKLSP